VHHLVISALQEAGVDGAEGRDTLCGQASSEADCVLLRDSHIKNALREALLKAVQACKQFAQQEALAVVWHWVERN
jgi:hypothetical protein